MQIKLVCFHVFIFIFDIEQICNWHQNGNWLVTILCSSLILFQNAILKFKPTIRHLKLESFIYYTKLCTYMLLWKDRTEHARAGISTNSIFDFSASLRDLLRHVRPDEKAKKRTGELSLSKPIFGGKKLGKKGHKDLSHPFLYSNQI